MRRVIRALNSARLTVLLLSVFAVLFTLSTLIPQKSLLQQKLYTEWQAESPTVVWLLESIGFTEIFMSPITLALWALFFANLAVVMWKRIPAVGQRIGLAPSKVTDPARAKAYTARGTLQFSAPAKVEWVWDAFVYGGFAMAGARDAFYAVKNRFSPLATLGFHLSFFVIMGGGLTVHYSTFIGDVDLGEGEVFRGLDAQYVPRPRMPLIGTPPTEHFVVESIRPQVVGDTPTGVKITVRDPDGDRHTIEINRPYQPSTSAFGMKNIGMAPLFVLTDDTGKERGGAYFRLQVLNAGADEFEIDGYEFEVTFFPDFEMRDGVPRTRSREFRNPAFLVTPLSTVLDKEPKILQKGQTVSVGPLKLTLKDVRYWARIFVRKQFGIWAVFFGFGLACASLIWRLVFYRREYLVRVSQNDEGALEVVVAGRAEFYRYIFDEEFEETMQRMNKRVMKNIEAGS